MNASKRPPNLELLLDKEVTTSAGERIVLSSFVIEDIAENPDDPESSPGGGGLVLQVTVDGERLTFSDVPEAYRPKKVGWTDELRLEMVDYNESANTARFYLDRIGDQSKYRRHTTLAKGASVELDDGWSMRFDSHGHKMVGPGQSSPLIVRVSYRKKSTSIDDSHNLYPKDPKDRSWTWRDYRFEIGNYQYDKSMDLSVRRMELKPAELVK